MFIFCLSRTYFLYTKWWTHTLTYSLRKYKHIYTTAESNKNKTKKTKKNKKNQIRTYRINVFIFRDFWSSSRRCGGAHSPSCTWMDLMPSSRHSSLSANYRKTYRPICTKVVNLLLPSFLKFSSDTRRKIVGITSLFVILLVNI